MRKIYTSIDIGTYSIKFVVGEVIDEKVYILASHCISSKGIRKGLVVEPNLVINSIKDGLSEINQMLGISIKKVIVNVPSYNVKYTPVSGVVDIDGVVTSDDINRVVKDSVYNKLDNNYELVTVVDTDYIVDGNNIIGKPVGKNGQKLEIKGIMISTPKKNIYSVLSVIEGAGLEVVDITISSLSNYYEIRNNNLDSKFGVVIDLGHETTTVSVFNHGLIVDSETLQMGGINIEKDIAYVFGLSVLDGRTLKEKFASSHKRFCQLSEVFEIKNTIGDTLKLNQLEVSEVVMSRLLQILNLCKKEIRVLTNQDIGYVVLTGGLTEIKSFKNLAYDVFGKNVVIYTITTLGVRDNKYCSALGMVKYFHNKMNVRGREYSMFTLEEETVIGTPSNKSRKDNAIINKFFGNFVASKEDK